MKLPIAVNGYGIDAETLNIRAAEVTTSSIGDAPVLPDLLAQSRTDEQISSVGGDGAYDTKKCHAAIAERDDADAVIPVRRNGRPWKDNGREDAGLYGRRIRYVRTAAISGWRT